MMKTLRTLLLAVLLAPLAAMAEGSIDINTADSATLERLNGIGPAKAQAIVAFREANGPFASVEELVRVPGIGEKSMDRLREHISVSAPAGAAAPAASASSAGN